MRKLLVSFSILINGLIAYTQNRPFGDASSREKADYYWEVMLMSRDSALMKDAAENAIVHYLNVIDKAEDTSGFGAVDIFAKLCRCDIVLKDYAAAEKWMNRILTAVSETIGTQSDVYANALVIVAALLAESGDLRQASSILGKAREIYGKYGNGPFNGADTLQRISFLTVRADIRIKQRKLGAVIDARQLVKLNLDYYGSGSEQYARALLELSNIFTELYCPGRARRYASNAYSVSTQNFVRRLGTLTEDARSRYWTSNSDYFRSLIFGGGSPEVAYNSALLIKRILLNTSREYAEFLKENADSSIMADYNLMNALIVSGGNDLTVDSLDKVILEKLKAKGAYFVPDLLADWKEVQSCLGEDDLAVEFVNDGNEYAVLLLKKNWPGPYNAGSFIIRKDAPVLVKDIWGKHVRRHFPKTPEGRIFFSPDGELEYMGIEYLPLFKNMDSPEESVYCLADIYPVYRLSSTRQLVIAEADSVSVSSVGLYGGVDYGARAHMRMIAADTAKKGGRRLIDEPYEEELRFYINNGGELEPLPGTAEEIHGIDSIMTDAGYVAHIFTGANASEDVFRLVSGEEDILHIATHGFYLTPIEAANKRIAGNSLMLLNDPLYRSGLHLSGARRAWLYNTESSELQDGILTANEISTLDLSGVDMVVLSACQSGLGEKGQDGLYGLQRAFKKAGVKSMIVSLNEVDDQATAFMMTDFYQNRYILGMSKYDAFMSALRAMRNTPEWNSPEYWNSFILIDAI